MSLYARLKMSWENDSFYRRQIPKFTDRYSTKDSVFTCLKIQTNLENMALSIVVSVKRMNISYVEKIEMKIAVIRL